MAFDHVYHESTLSPDDLRSTVGPVVVEFGATWCGICSAFTHQAAREFEAFPQVQHIRVEDGPGKRLGRSFRVKLWPSFVFLLNGEVVDQVARPDRGQLRAGLEKITE